MPKTITICGSMKFMSEMKEWQKKLESQEYHVVTPLLVDFHDLRDIQGDEKTFEEFKRRETKNHFEKIKNSDIVLVLNYDKNGAKNYIGGNSFAEIAYAVALNYCHQKNIEIYTVNPIPEDSPYSEELKAWQVKQWTSNE